MSRGCRLDVKIIDYKPEYLSKDYYLWGMNPRFDKNFLTRLFYYSIKLPKRIKRLFSKRKLSYDRLKKENLCVTPKKYFSNEDLKRNIPDADVFIAGSDQIWNPVLENGKDPAFFGFCSRRQKKIAYAASFSVDNIPVELKDVVTSYLKKFDAISVRESSAVKIIRDLGVGDVKHVVDPVFLLERYEWEKIAGKKQKEKYVLVYDFDANTLIKGCAEKLAKENEWKVYSVLKSDYADKSFHDCGPDEFVALVAGAQYVISNSFHATAFSIIFHTPFYVFNREWGINSRMRDLVDACGIESRLISELPSEYEKIEWDNVDNKVISLIDESKRFILKSLGESHD